MICGCLPLLWCRASFDGMREKMLATGQSDHWTGKVGLCGLKPAATQRLLRSSLQAAILLSVILAPLGAIAQDVTSSSAAQVSREGNDLRSNDREADSQAFARADVAQDALCLIVESAARANDLPVEFFAHVIWQESHFRPLAVGPLTHMGQRARGIAQFMPETARERGLLDPFNPVQALPKAAQFLADLRRQFGNIGLAAAAYNAGPRRLREWLAGNGEMPTETRNYVLATTGRRLEDWQAIGKNGISDKEANTTCRDIVVTLKQEPNRFLSRLGDSIARAVTSPWGVQVATGFNRDQALMAYANAIKEFNAAIGPRAGPTLQPILFRSRGTSSFYQVRIGASTHREAENLCKQIRAAHGACLVKRRGA